jgi:uncharacterized membrane protein YfcA
MVGKKLLLEFLLKTKVVSMKPMKNFSLAGRSDVGFIPSTRFLKLLYFLIFIFFFFFFFKKKKKKKKKKAHFSKCDYHIPTISSSFFFFSVMFVVN